MCNHQAIIKIQRLPLWLLHDDNSWIDAATLVQRYTSITPLFSPECSVRHIIRVYAGIIAGIIARNLVLFARWRGTVTYFF